MARVLLSPPEIPEWLVFCRRASQVMRPVAALLMFIMASACSEAALAQTLPDKNVCPLSDEQAQKSIQAFDKIANVFAKEPRCVNCHGAVDPFAAEAKETHGGGKLVPILKKKPNAASGETESTQDEIGTIQQCAACHGAFSGIWRTPRPALFLWEKMRLHYARMREISSAAPERSSIISNMM